MLDFEIPQNFTLIPEFYVDPKWNPYKRKLEPDKVLTDVAPTGIEPVFHA